MRTVLKGALACLLAAGFSGWGAAAECIAEWKGFAGDALTSGPMTANLNGNTWNAEGGYVEIGTNALLLTGTRTWNPRSAGANTPLTLVVRFSNLTNDNTLSAEQTLVSLTLGSLDNQLGLLTRSGGGAPTGLWGGAVWKTSDNTAVALPSDKAEHVLVFRYGENGTYAYAPEGDAWTQRYGASGLRGTGDVGGKIALGAKTNGTLPATGLRIHAVSVWYGDLTDEEKTLAATLLAHPLARERTLAAGTADWQVSEGTTDWGTDGAVAPSAEETTRLTLTGDATLTMNAAGVAKVLDVGGTGTLTFSAGEGEGMALTAAATRVGTDVVAASGVASLGKTFIDRGKTLTLARPDATLTPSFVVMPGSGEEATVRYVGPLTGALSSMPGIVTELAAKETSAGLSVTPAGGTLRFASGDYGTLTLGLSATNTNVEFLGANVDVGTGGDFAFGTATAAISSGTIKAARLVTVHGGDNRVTRVTQNGGDITLSGTASGVTSGSGTAGNQATILMGHYARGSSSYTLAGGSLVAENGGLQLGHDSPADLTVSGGRLRVKGIRGRASQTCHLTLSGGSLEIGPEGFDSVNNLTATLSGGELHAFDNAGIAQAMSVTGPVAFSAAADKTMTVTGALSGAGSLTVGSEGKTGTVTFGERTDLSGLTGAVTVAAGELDVSLAMLGEGVPRLSAKANATLIIASKTERHLDSVEAGATLKIRLTDEERNLTGYTATNLPENVRPVFIFSDGTEAPAENISEDGLGYGVSLPTWSPKAPTEGDAAKYAWDNADNWSVAAVPEEGANVAVKIPEAGAATMILPQAGAPVGSMEVLGQGSLTLESPDGGALTVSGILACKTDVTMDSVAVTAGEVHIDEGVTLTLKGAATLSVTTGIFGKGTLRLENDTPPAGGYPGLNDAQGWQGRVVFAKSHAFSGDTTGAGLDLSAYGNEESEIAFAEGVTCSGCFKKANVTCGADIILDGSVSISQGYSGQVYAFSGNLSGKGTFTLSGTPGDCVRFAGDVSRFEGAMEVTGTGRSIVFGTAAAQAGKLVITDGVTVAVPAGKTWKAKQGIVVNGTLSLSHAGAIGDAASTPSVTGTGSVAIPQDVTVTIPANQSWNVAASGAGALIVAEGATMDLGKTWSVTGGVTVNGAVNVVSGGSLGNGPKAVNGTVSMVSGGGGLGTGGAISGSGTIVVTGTLTGGSNIDVLASTSAANTIEARLNAFALNNANDWKGTVCLKTAGNRSQLTLGKYGNENSTIAFQGAQGWIPTGTVVTATAALLKDDAGDGLSLNNGSSSVATDVVFRKLTGEGSLQGCNALSGGAAYKYNLFVESVSPDFTGTVALDATNDKEFAVVFGAKPATYSHDTLKGKITVLSGAEVAVPPDREWTAPNGVVVEGTLGGTGTVGSALTFSAGAALASDGATPLKATGAVTFPSAAESLTVTLPEGFTASTEGVPVLATNGLAAPAFGTYTLTSGGAAVTNALLVGKEDGLYVAKPSVASAEGAPALEESTQEAVAAAAVKAGVATVTIASDSDSVEGATLFSGVEIVVTPDAQNPASGTAKVSYDFGIERMTIRAMRDGSGNEAPYVVLAARVRNTENSADYAEGTHVKVYGVAEGGATQIPDAEVMTDPPEGESKENGVKWIRFPLTALDGRDTFSLTVRAENTPDAGGGTTP